MANLARRLALKKLGMGAAAAPMMPAVVASGVGLGPAPGSNFLGGGAPAVAPQGGPWESLGITEKAWRILMREHDDHRMRDTQRRAALLGVVEADIACLVSLSPTAKAAMQVRREIERRRVDRDWERRLWGNQD